MLWWNAFDFAWEAWKCLQENPVFSFKFILATKWKLMIRWNSLFPTLIGNLKPMTYWQCVLCSSQPRRGCIIIPKYEKYKNVPYAWCSSHIFLQPSECLQLVKQFSVSTSCHAMTLTYCCSFSCTLSRRAINNSWNELCQTKDAVQHKNIIATWIPLTQISSVCKHRSAGRHVIHIGN